MIAASWTMSTIISIPPLFGLKDPTDDSLQTINGSRAALPRLRLTTADEPNDLPLSDKHDFWADIGLSDGGQSFAMNSADASLSHVGEDINETISSESDETELNCIISQNLGYTFRLLSKSGKNRASEVAMNEQVFWMTLGIGKSRRWITR